ncbi:MAG: HD domain-containing phosphohydrolase [Terriglobales bacterium]|jgi:HD-GYP domain-containing protein (c-di-GMP phosphodiesterase class II)
MRTRVPLLYLILAVLLVISVVPVWLFGTKVVSISKDKLKTNEMLLQNTITRSLSEDVGQRLNNLRLMMASLSTGVQVSSGGDLSGKNVETPELRALLERFVTSQNGMVPYITLLNDEPKGISAGSIPLDDFMRRELEHAFEAARDGRSYTGQALSTGAGKDARTVILISTPIIAADRTIGMIGAVVDLQFLIDRLKGASQGGLVTYVVDRQGRLVAAGAGNYATGQDMTNFEIAKNFVEQGGRNQFVATKEFETKGPDSMEMLGTYSPVATLDWAVVAQKPQTEAYQSANEMQTTAKYLALIAVVLSMMISIFSARQITNPLEQLTVSSRAIAKGDFSQRVTLKSKTEIGELASTFNSMSQDLERFVYDLKRAAEENRSLFLSSIQMLAGAVDEKDPYTKGHSDRVTRYSVLLATELGLITEEIEKIRIAAQLHDVGKIGIEDRILKKPGALTPDEFEIMKTHTTKGGSILRPVASLKEMIPGIEGHHESLDGRGYPYGLKGDQLPLMPRVIMVADTFDAMTTNRPYQAAMDPEYVVRIINSLATTKFDPRVVKALTAVFERGGFRIHRAATVTGEQVAEAAAAGSAPPAQ